MNKNTFTFIDKTTAKLDDQQQRSVICTVSANSMDIIFTPELCNEIFELLNSSPTKEITRATKGSVYGAIEKWCRDKMEWNSCDQIICFEKCVVDIKSDDWFELLDNICLVNSFRHVCGFTFITHQPDGINYSFREIIMIGNPIESKIAANMQKTCLGQIREISARLCSLEQQIIADRQIDEIINLRKQIVELKKLLDDTETELCDTKQRMECYVAQDELKTSEIIRLRSLSSQILSPAAKKTDTDNLLLT